jgi:hypothetical protein
MDLSYDQAQEGVDFPCGDSVLPQYFTLRATRFSV